MTVRSELFAADHRGALARADARDAGSPPAPGLPAVDLLGVDAIDVELLGTVAARAVQFGTGELELQEVDLEHESLVELGRVDDLALPAEVAAEWAADDDITVSADQARALVTSIIALATAAAAAGSAVYLWADAAAV